VLARIVRGENLTCVETDGKCAKGMKVYFLLSILVVSMMGPHTRPSMPALFAVVINS
jgi:hypothetical protein